MKRIFAIALALALLTGCAASAQPLASEISAPGAPAAQTPGNLDSTSAENAPFTAATTVAEVEAEPAFAGFGTLLFPLHGESGESLTPDSIDTLMPYHNDIRVETTLDVLNTMRETAQSGETIFYDIYTEEEKAADPAKKNTGLFFFRGEAGAPFAVINAGGGFSYVGALHESFPHALALSRQGYNAFALIYRTGGAEVACEDLAAALGFIFDHAGELGVSTENYSSGAARRGHEWRPTLGPTVRRPSAGLTCPGLPPSSCSTQATAIIPNTTRPPSPVWARRTVSPTGTRWRPALRV